MNRFPWWKNALIALVVVAGIVYAVPNIFGRDYAILIDPIDERQGRIIDAQQLQQWMETAGVSPRTLSHEGRSWLLRFKKPEEQALAADILRSELSAEFQVTLQLVARTPAFLRFIGAKAMVLGLDLRGGVHLLMEVDMDAAHEKFVERTQREIIELLRQKRLHYTSIASKRYGLRIDFRDKDALLRAHALLEDEFIQLKWDVDESQLRLTANLSASEQAQIEKMALEQNIITLRNRIDELGVASPVVHRQGQNRIVVELPGVQDVARAKSILGAVATLEMHLVDMVNDPAMVARTGRKPVGSRLYKTKEGMPVLLKREVIVTGDQLVDARSGFDSQNRNPAVFITLDGQAAKRMGATTRANVGKPMAVLFIETRSEWQERDGELERIRTTSEKVISVATIQEAFSQRFQITGLSTGEAHDLALLLRAGSLAAPVDIVEERTVGPSLGERNIRTGLNAMMAGLALVMIFMPLRYRRFGFIADIALVVNIILLVALMSLLQATLTLPGIAGIVLTVGMAVDANVLIFQRIRQEQFNGVSPQASINAGFDKAFSTITDANVTTLIAAVVLFGLGSGPVKGFAVTLTLGIMTSLFCAILVTRALVNLMFGHSRMKHVPI